jgi:hypothetical protein
LGDVKSKFNGELDQQGIESPNFIVNLSIYIGAALVGITFLSLMFLFAKFKMCSKKIK